MEEGFWKTNMQKLNLNTTGNSKTEQPGEKGLLGFMGIIFSPQEKDGPGCHA